MKKLLLVRPEGKNQADAQFFAGRYESLELPLFQIIQNQLLPATVKQIQTSDWLIFTSQNAVASVLEVAKKDVKIAAIGQKTADLIKSSDFSVEFIPSKADKIALVQEFQEKYKHQTIFYPKSELADDYIEEKLGKDNRITSFIAYQNQPLATNQMRLARLLEEQKIDAVYLTSPSAWRCFHQVYQNYLYPLELIVIGQTTKAAVEADGFKAIEKVISNKLNC